jgi:hypothetical protein
MTITTAQHVHYTLVKIVLLLPDLWQRISQAILTVESDGSWVIM